MNFIFNFCLGLIITEIIFECFLSKISKDINFIPTKKFRGMWESKLQYSHSQYNFVFKSKKYDIIYIKITSPIVFWKPVNSFAILIFSFCSEILPNNDGLI